MPVDEEGMYEGYQAEHRQAHVNLHIHEEGGIH